MIFLSTKIINNKMIKPLIFGLIVSTIITIILIAFCAIIATNLESSEETILIMAIISMTLGAFCGGIISAKIYNEKGFLLGALNGIVYFFFITFISLCINAESMTLISLIKLIAFTLSSMIGGVIGVNTRKRRVF